MISSFLLITGVFVGIFVLGELLHRVWNVSAEITRKTVHILAGLLAATLPWYLTFPKVILLGVIFTALLIGSKRFNLLPSVHAVERSTFGEVAFPLGLLLSALLFFRDHPQAFQFGALTLALADSSASLVGQKVGRREYVIGGIRKTFEGSFAFFMVAVILGAIFSSTNQTLSANLLPQAITTGAVLTVVEAVAIRGWDNLVLPAAAGMLGVWLGLL